ncbi:hypothetical protein Tco_1212417 [Tanacetum coccineum]
MRKVSAVSSSGTFVKSSPSTLRQILRIVLKTSALTVHFLYGESLEAHGILDNVNDHLKRLFLLWHSGFQSDIGRADLDSLSRGNQLFITSSSL